MLQNIEDWSDKNNLKYRGKSIPIVRVDISESNDALQNEKLFISKNSLPKVYFYVKGTYYNYEENYQAHFFLHFMNRHLYPIVLLKTKKDVDNFINTTLDWKENTPFKIQVRYFITKL